MNDTAVTDVGATNPTILFIFFYANFTSGIMKKEVSETHVVGENPTFPMECVPPIGPSFFFSHEKHVPL